MIDRYSVCYSEDMRRIVVTHGLEYVAELSSFVAESLPILVFFSAPLDIDFMMLEQMEAEYKKSLDTTEGPRLEVTIGEEKKRILIQTIEGTDDYRTEYETRIKKDIKSTLKEEGGDGSTYSAEQQKLMVWYTYFFLNRGKPSTHIAVLSRLIDEAIKNNIPPVLKRLMETAESILKGDKK